MNPIVQALLGNSRGILAADESTGTIEKRFKSIGLSSTDETRRAYRELLFNAPGIGDYISGAILFDETIRQKTSSGETMVELLRRQNIIPGIKVDAGAKPLAGFPGEKITEGLDGLRSRLADYYKLGARFTKWRAVIAIGEGIPTATCLRSNAEALARFAALSQEAQLVPIVEPEILMDGNHSLDRHAEVTEQALACVFAALREHRVQLEGMLLKTNMALPGADTPTQASPEVVAKKTLQVLKATVPPAVPGVVFLSGGQNPEEATRNLAALNQSSILPWALSFSYGRALQEPALSAWRGDYKNIVPAQQALLERCRLNAAARNPRV